jgi:hypothetical protein
MNDGQLRQREAICNPRTLECTMPTHVHVRTAWELDVAHNVAYAPFLEMGRADLAIRAEAELFSMTLRERREKAREEGVYYARARSLLRDLAQRQLGAAMARDTERAALRAAPWPVRLDLWWMRQRLRWQARPGVRLHVYVPTGHTPAGTS